MVAARGGFLSREPSLPPEQDDVCVAITGAAGQIAYALVPLIAHGRVFGEGRKVRLRLLDIEACADALKGVAMEIEDCYSELVCSAVSGFLPCAGEGILAVRRRLGKWRHLLFYAST